MKTKQKNLCGVILLALFAALAVSVKIQSGWLQSFDSGMRTLATKSISPLNTAGFKVIAFFGSPATVIGMTVLLSIWLWYRRDITEALWVLGLQLGDSVIAEIIKMLVARQRPVHQLVPDTGFSFPSGHALCTSLMVFTLLMLLLPKIKDQETQLVAVMAGALWIILVAVARVYLRDHFASDVTGSVLLAAGYWLIVTPYAVQIKGCMRRVLPERIR
ncbi:phosphatase PAP2 family protein [Lacticaseibacillus zhaodongensis]|uniref:phosphatase PAP2 family protein n=1 Tax=Lacticaseibacillus zhaodongensis TaxID=2668065 RepID=UPI0012D2B64B|nr:phosphatase PAP2 family protein [Lacticaseibacillus zhaodongensis]